MRIADAPPAGWYPDPTGRDGLRWWDGLDWSDHRRPPLPRGLPEVEVPVASGDDAGGPNAALQGALADVAGRASGRAATSRDETAEMMAEVRRVTRDEVERAVNLATERARDATRSIQPLVSEYGDRVLRGLRIAGIVVVALVVLWMVLQTVGQTTLLEFLGDRIDNVTGGMVGPRLAPPGG